LPVQIVLLWLLWLVVPIIAPVTVAVSTSLGLCPVRVTLGLPVPVVTQSATQLDAQEIAWGRGSAFHRDVFVMKVSPESTVVLLLHHVKAAPVALATEFV
jgi:hypothetical protein